MLTDTNTEYRLAQFSYDAVKSCAFQVGYGCCCLTLSRKNDTIGTPDFFRIACNDRFYSDAVQCIDYRANIARIILDYSSFHERIVD